MRSAPSRRRFRGGLVLVALALAACAPTPRGTAGRTTTTARTATTAPAPTTTAPTIPVTPVQWAPCGALQCGTVTVPLNYARPQAGTIRIALARHPATDPAQRIGALVIDPGGPGASGVNDLPQELRVLTPELLARFDIVEFDPRGVERSDPVECSTHPQPPSAQGPLPDPVPTSSAAQQALIANDKAYAADCEKVSGGLLPYVGTVDAAQDLDRVRLALGDAQLTFFGHSYGTLLGAVYAQMFPTHVRAMVLDGAIDPAMSTTQMVVEQGRSFESVLNSFFS
ncbi:MAG TPA: alpha/beta fold hydrolase, partial [Acidimicrobiales bacterium]|nr:alpha/beta fold hydrolase [Acidimicrobiales bacterium]